MWAFATAGIPASVLFEAVMKRLVRRGVRAADGWSPQALSIVAWAYATAHAPGRYAVLDAVSAEVVSRGLRGFAALGVANLLWACASSSAPDPESMHATMSGDDAVQIERFTLQARGRIAPFNVLQTFGTNFSFDVADTPARRQH